MAESVRLEERRDERGHERDEAAERDQLKDELLKLAGVTLVRIRAEDTKNVRAEDFNSLLMAEAEMLNKLRPRRLRPRRNPNMLVPAEEACRVSDMAKN